jgi:hypothetical protein
LSKYSEHSETDPDVELVWGKFHALLCVDNGGNFMLFSFGLTCPGDETVTFGVVGFWTLEQFEFTQQRQMSSDELYSHRHVAETPPPLASVCDNQTHSLHQSRLPPIPRYKSIAHIPTVPPPSYEEVISHRY